MQIAFILVSLVATVIVFAQVAERTGVPAPIVLLFVGIVASALPFIPDIPLSPEIVLYGLLPPLLYAAAQGTSIAALRNYLTGIFGLSVGLVLFTAFGVAAVVYLVLPVPFAVAVALGAIVAPPDAVAATAVARRIGLPRSVTTILEGESLFNDATALVTLRTAIVIAGFASATTPPRTGHLDGRARRLQLGHRRRHRHRAGRCVHHRQDPSAGDTSNG